MYFSDAGRCSKLGFDSLRGVYTLVAVLNERSPRRGSLHSIYLFLGVGVFRKVLLNQPLTMTLSGNYNLEYHNSLTLWNL